MDELQGLLSSHPDFFNTWGKAWPVLDFMQKRGSCVTLSWDEEMNLWELSWITSGKRFVGHAETPYQAIWIAADKAVAWKLAQTERVYERKG